MWPDNVTCHLLLFYYFKVRDICGRPWVFNHRYIIAISKKKINRVLQKPLTTQKQP
jgi:hypothetical protein